MLNKAKTLIQECLDFGILTGQNGKIRVFFVPEGKKRG